MAFKLNGAMKIRRDDLVAKLEAHKAAIAAAFEAYNADLEDAREFMNNDIVGHFNDEFDEKSEKWQEGDRADAVRSWLDEIDNAAVDLTDIDFDESEIDGHIEALNLIAEEPSY